MLVREPASALHTGGQLIQAGPLGGANKKFVYLEKHSLAQIKEDGSITYSHTDALGSPVARTSASGALTCRTHCEPYGLVAGGTPQQIGFTGHVNDLDTGLTYMQQRYYDPVAGRFLSIDPLVTNANTGSSFNRYAYAAGNPYKYVDPDGRNPKLIADFALNVGLSVVTTGKLGLAVALKETVVGALNPVKTMNTAAKLASAIYTGSKLARNMAKAGRGVAKGKEEAHHIVAQTDKRAAGSREILDRNGINVHDAGNGTAMAKADHRGVHTNEYHANVEQRLTTAESRGTCSDSCKAEVRAELTEIGKELKK